MKPEILEKQAEGLKILKEDYNSYTQIVGERSNFIALSVIASFWAIYGTQEGFVAATPNSMTMSFSLGSSLLLLILNVIVPSWKAWLIYNRFDEMTDVSKVEDEIEKDLKGDKESMFPYTKWIQTSGQVLLVLRTLLSVVSGTLLIIHFFALSAVMKEKNDLISREATIKALEKK